MRCAESRRGSPDGGLSAVDARLTLIARQWGRIGVTGFGGPPAHIDLLRRLVVRPERLDEREFEDAIAACNMLPGPASTQLAIFCAQRLGGQAGAVIGGVGFIAPAVVLMLALSAIFLAHSPPTWVRGAGAGAGAAVAAVAVRAGLGLARPSHHRAAGEGRRLRWFLYLALGAAFAARLGSYLVLVLIACGALELFRGSIPRSRRAAGSLALPMMAIHAGGLGALAWVAVKVGALSFGGGFVIVPLIQHDAVHTYHWMTTTGFATAVALGQVTPGPVVSTVAAVGYAARGVGGGVLAAGIAFLPSFLMVMAGGGRFLRLREAPRAQRFLAGAGPAAIGAIFGAAVPLAGAITELWQAVLLALAAIALLLLRRGIVLTLVASGAAGALLALAGAPVPR